MQSSEIRQYFDDDKILVDHFESKCGEIGEFEMNATALYSMIFMRGIAVENLLEPIQTIENLYIQPVEQQSSVTDY